MNVLITGATGGIGQALIEVFYKNSWNILAVGRNKKILEELKLKYGDKIEIYSRDIGKEKEIIEFLEEIRGREIDLLINGAGIGEIGEFENISLIEEQRMIDINIQALLILTKYFYKKMLERKEGGIINISSTAGFQVGGPLMCGYYATKAYVNSLTFGLIEESKGKNIKIMLLCPGPTATNFKGMKSEIEGAKKFYITTPEEVANQCYRDYISGKKLSIPGRVNRILYYLNKFIPWKIQLKNIEKIQRKKQIETLN
ncbi:SDR family NAD(P)-dependent oxidoreductase [Fusobacterium varium]|nr:SDR family NAD(P)-dependent oxidoreductase [Fusobacterium varium]